MKIRFFSLISKISREDMNTLILLPTFKYELNTYKVLAS